MKLRCDCQSSGIDTSTWATCWEMNENHTRTTYGQLAHPEDNNEERNEEIRTN